MSKTITDSTPITSANGITINTDYLQTGNCTVCSSRSVKYIVMHYTGNSSDTAIANAKYFKNTANLSASAHYFVDDSEIYQSVALKNRAWHCGASSYWHDECRNTNSIGIEMACTAGNYRVSDTTIENAAYLAAAVAEYLGISSTDADKYIVRHYDVTGKECPKQWATTTSSEFEAFKMRVKEIMNGGSSSSDYLTKLVAKGVITDTSIWGESTAPTTKSQAVALIDKCTSGMWTSEEDDPSIHWVQPYVISLCGKKIITDKSTWLTDPDANISKALMLALVDNATDGMKSTYQGRATDHWGRNHLDSLCDKGIIKTPASWTDFEAECPRGNALALVWKAFYA